MRKVKVTITTERGRALGTHVIDVDENYAIKTEAGQLNLRIESYRELYLCAKCYEPMVFTTEFPGWERYCQACGWGCGMFGAAFSATSTPKLRARHANLQAEYRLAREARQMERN